MSKNILFFDDRYASLDTVTFLEDCNYCVYWAKEFLSANYYINFDPGIQSLISMIVDLEIPYNEDDFSEKEKKDLNNYPVNVSGWIWIKKILLNYDYKGKILILSGHRLSIVSEDIKKYDDRVIYISKGSGRVLESIDRILKTTVVAES